MNKKANWQLEAIFGLVGLALLGDSIFIKTILPVNRLLEGLIGAVLIIIAIWIRIKK